MKYRCEFGKLITPDTKLQRQYFKQMVDLIGVYALFESPKAKDYNNVSTAVDNGMKVIVNKITNEANKYTYSTISASKTTMEENLLKELQELFKTETIETVLINMVVQ